MRVVTILAGHAGRWLEHELEREGIPVESIWVDGESRSSLSVADRSGGGLTEFYEHGVAITADAWRRFAARTSTLSRTAAWVTISGSLPPGAPADGYRGLEIACAARRRHRRGAARLGRPGQGERRRGRPPDRPGDGHGRGRPGRRPGAAQRRRHRRRDPGARRRGAGHARRRRALAGRSTHPAPIRWEAATRSWPGWSSPARAEPAGTTRCGWRSGRRRPTPPCPGPPASPGPRPSGWPERAVVSRGVTASPRRGVEHVGGAGVERERQHLARGRARAGLEPRRDRHRLAGATRERAVHHHLAPQRLHHLDDQAERGPAVAVTGERQRAPAARRARPRRPAAPGSGMVTVPAVSTPPRTAAGSRFIGGLPMKPATNRLAGRS